MLLPVAPALLNLLVVTANLDEFGKLVHQSCLADRYYGTHGDQSPFTLDPDFHCDPSELNLRLGRESSLIPVHPHHELLFVKKMEIEGAITDEDTLLGGLERLAAHTTGEAPATLGTQWPLIADAPMYTIPYYTESSAILTISPHLLPHIDKALPLSYKAYAIPRIPVPFRRVPEEARERIRRWTDSVEYDGTIAWIVEGLSVSQLRNDVRYLTGEDPDSPILSRSSFSEGARLAAEWILEQIEETGAECELKLFLVGFAPNVVWCATSSCSDVTAQGRLPSVSKYRPLDESAGTIILSSHYDSRGSLGNSRAPGGDDNGGYL